MREFMTIDGNKFLFEKYIEPQGNEMFFSKIIDRRVMGSMNDLVFQAKVHINMGKLSPSDFSFRLNESPMSYLSYSRSKDEFKKQFFIDGGLSGKRQRENNVIYINTVRPSKTK
jgi:hypothetical protein